MRDVDSRWLCNLRQNCMRGLGLDGGRALLTKQLDDMKMVRKEDDERNVRVCN